MRWLVPADYPRFSPMLLDALPGAWRLEIIEFIQVVSIFAFVMMNCLEHLQERTSSITPDSSGTLSSSFWQNVNHVMMLSA